MSNLIKHHQFLSIVTSLKFEESFGMMAHIPEQVFVEKVNAYVKRTRRTEKYSLILMKSCPLTWYLIPYLDQMNAFM